MPEVYNSRGKLLCRYEGPFQQIDFEAFDFSDAQLSSLILEGLLMENARFRGANLQGVDWYWATLLDCDFSFANLRGAVFQGANLFRSSFAGADLRGAKFSPSNLGGASQFTEVDLRGCLWEGADFKKVIYDNGTLFPEGFDPDEEGMVLSPVKSPELVDG